ncbi:MAG TPA: hydroxyacid dehydrogenase [Campylobacterales bacterium]|nr:hydroxyacid dehydrogenase [Campylobacterales bacterium]
MKIVATSPSFSKNRKLQEEIYRYFPNAKLNLEGKRFTKEELIQFIGDADGAIVGLEEIDDEVVEACPNLKIVSKYGVGLNNLKFNNPNIQIGWTGGVNRLSVAELVLGYMLMLARNIYITSNQLKSGTWNKSGGFQLSGKTIGIIGVGYIGKELIRLLQPFNCEILVYDVIDQTEYYNSVGVKEVDIPTILRNSDFVTLHVPLNKDTKNMISTEEFRTMKKSAYIINSARGGVVDEEALKEALKSGEIAGGAIDVYTTEPPTDTELINLPNLITTPHIGGNAEEAVLAMGMSAIQHLREFFKV